MFSWRSDDLNKRTLKWLLLEIETLCKQKEIRKERKKYIIEQPVIWAVLDGPNRKLTEERFMSECLVKINFLLLAITHDFLMITNQD